VTALGYIRQSRRADLDVALSYDAQLAAIHRMAALDGLEPGAVTITADMGRSGGAGRERFRPAYRTMLEAMATGSIDTIYSLSMSRLGRSTKELLRVYELAVEHGVRIVYAKEGEIRFATPDGKLRATILAAVYEFERDLAVERAADNVRVRRVRGDLMGRWPYGTRPGEDPAVILAAYEAAGRTFSGAARILTDRGVPCALDGPGRPKRQWNNGGVRKVLERYYADQIPAVTPTGRRAAPTRHRLWRLIRCSCGRWMTSARDEHRGPNGTTYLRCYRGTADSAHPRPFHVRESVLIEMIREEAAHLRITDPRTGKPLTEFSLEEETTERESLQAEREAILEMAQRRMIGMDDAERRVREVDERSAALGTAADVVVLGPIRWDAPAAELNAFLRAMFVEFRMSPDMATAEAVWRDRSLRAD
jgi:DNA invertase Pin-like site-specific DNA recombinase